MNEPESKMDPADGRQGGAGARLPLTSLVRATVFFALLTGLVEVLVRPLLPIHFGSLTRHPTYLVWMAPAGLLATYLVWTLIVALVGLLIRPLARPRAAATLIMFPFFATLVMIALPRIEDYATIILALGLATVVMRVWFLVLPRLPFLAQLAVPVSLLMVLGFAVGTFMVRQETSLGPPEKGVRAGAPNVIFITLDTLRAASMSLHGYERATTPELVKLAEESTVYDRAFAVTSWTLPSHASMFTGLWSHQTGTDWTVPLAAAPATLASIFREQGYDTAGFVANLAYCTARSGLDRGFAHYEDHRPTLRTLLSCTRIGYLLDDLSYRVRGRDRLAYPGRKDAAMISRDFLAWLDHREGDRPFFAFLNYFDVHQPYVAPEPFDSMFDRRAAGADERAVIRLAAKGAEHQLDAMDRYDGAIRYLDHELGALIADLRRRGLLENTLLVITSDHGETFAEHPAAGHGVNLYAETVHVPLLLRGPGIPAGRRVSREVSLRDLGRSVLEFAAPADDEALSFPGMVLPLDDADPRPVSPVFCQLSRGIRQPATARNQNGAVLALVRDSLHFIRHRDPRLEDELYDLERDPFERDDVVADEDYAERLATLRVLFEQISEAAR